MKKPPRVMVSFRLARETIERLERLAEKHDTTKTDVLERALESADRKGGGFGKRRETAP